MALNQRRDRMIVTDITGVTSHNNFGHGSARSNDRGFAHCDTIPLNVIDDARQFVVIVGMFFGHTPQYHPRASLATVEAF